jgi:hypothetical protein
MMASPQLEPFRYEPLSSEKPQIRLLKLIDLPSSGESGLEKRQCYHWQLTTFDLESALTYHALSYTWHCPFREEELQPSQYACIDWDSPSKEIIVNDRVFSVRMNLYQFLEVVQFEKSTEYLWIDAICIDQDEKKPERSHQVRQMREVYSKATSVIIWIGPADSSTDLAFDILSTSPQGFGSYNTTVFSVPEADRRHIPTISRLNRDHQLLFLESLLAFYRKPYWDRLWVIQEILLASNLRLKCGKREFSWTKIASLITEVRTSDLFINNETTTFYNGNLAWFISSRRENDLRDRVIDDFESLVQVTQRSHCSRLHDRIYGLLGLVPHGLDFEVDYEVKIVTLFLKVVTFFKHRDLFSFCSRVAQTLDQPIEELAKTISQEDGPECLIAQRKEFSLPIQLDHVGTVDMDGLRLSPTCSAPSFERLAHQGKNLLFHSCEAGDCRDIIVPMVTLEVFEIPNTELLLAFSSTIPYKFVAIGTWLNRHSVESTGISFHRMGVTFSSLCSRWPLDCKLHSSKFLAGRHSVKLNYQTFASLWTRTHAIPGPETGFHTNKWRKWRLNNNHTTSCPS